MDRSHTVAQEVVVGKIVAPWGVRGEVKVEVATDVPGRLAAGATVYVQGQARRIERCLGLPKRAVALKLEGIDNRSDAEALRNLPLTVPQELAPALPPDHYYHFQVLGMGVYTRSGDFLGRINAIRLSADHNDVYVVSDGQRELLLPAIGDVVLEVNVEGGRMIVDLPEGLS